MLARQHLRVHERRLEDWADKLRMDFADIVEIMGMWRRPVWMVVRMAANTAASQLYVRRNLEGHLLPSGGRQLHTL